MTRRGCASATGTRQSSSSVLRAPASSLASCQLPTSPPCCVFPFGSCSSARSLFFHTLDLSPGTVADVELWRGLQVESKAGNL
eukprot:202963-Rhodomonas_salina.1